MDVQDLVVVLDLDVVVVAAVAVVVPSTVVVQAGTIVRMIKTMSSIILKINRPHAVMRRAVIRQTPTV